jgi:hypothetical protein
MGINEVVQFQRLLSPTLPHRTLARIMVFRLQRISVLVASHNLMCFKSRNDCRISLAHRQSERSQSNIDNSQMNMGWMSVLQQLVVLMPQAWILESMTVDSFSSQYTSVAATLRLHLATGSIAGR